MKTLIEPIEPFYTQYRATGEAVQLPSKSYADGYRFRVRFYENDPKTFIEMRFFRAESAAKAFLSKI